MSCGGEQPLLSAPGQTDTGKSTDAVQARLPSAAPAPPLLPTGRSCRKQIELQWAAPPRGSMAQEEQGMNGLALGLKRSRSKATWPLARRSPPVQNVRVPCTLLASLFDRRLLCLNRLLGRRWALKHSSPSGPAARFPCFESKVPPILHAQHSWTPTSHHQPRSSGSSSFPEATATQNSTCRWREAPRISRGQHAWSMARAWKGKEGRRAERRENEAAPQPPSTPHHTLWEGAGRGQK